jgi:hypothetical protein
VLVMKVQARLPAERGPGVLVEGTLRALVFVQPQQFVPE